VSEASEPLEEDENKSPDSLKKCYSDNDIQFLEAAGLGICMNNSSAELEKVADEKLGDNNHENGVAKKVVAMIEGKNFVKPPPPPIPHPDILRLDQLS